MELTDWCTRILSADTLEEKLLSPKILTDNITSPAVFWKTPTRPPGMEFKKHNRKEKLPGFHEHNDPDKRAVCLHRFAGHELLAVEIMAYAILAFPEAPKHFRKGLANTLKEEQGHVRIYMQRLKEMGVQFGDLPLYKHFWAHTPFLTSPLKYVSVMSLTLEMANLDFAPTYKASFLKHGDEGSAALMNQILEDEIKHVSFGMHWLNKMKPSAESSWDTWRNSVPDKIPLHRARGKVVYVEPRTLAGIPSDWIAQIKNS
jgi:uncharacterized ferritin-like protein (DUF455 family)